MSSNAYATPLYLELKPSWLGATALLLIYILALVCIAMLPLAAWLQLLASSILLMLCVVEIRKILLMPSHVVTRIVWKQGAEWMLMHKNGDEMTASLLPSSYVHPLMTVLIFRVNRRWPRPAVVLLKDNIDFDSFRRLRVRLRLERQHLAD